MLSQEFLQELVLAVVNGLFLVLSTFVPSYLAYLIYLRHTLKKQAEGTALKALNELVFMRHVEDAYCESINPKEPETAKRMVRNQVAKKGFQSTQAFPPSELNRKIESYTRRVSEGLPAL